MTDREHSEDTNVPHDPDGLDTANVEDEDPGWPWSFILLVVAGAIYLIFRFAELFINLVN